MRLKSFISFSSLAAAAVLAAPALAQTLPPFPHLDAKDEQLVRERIAAFARVRTDLTDAAVDAAALLALVEGDAMPDDLAGLLGGGQRVWRTRAGGDGGIFIHFRHPKNPGAMSDVLVRTTEHGTRVTAVVRDGQGNAESVRTLDDGRMIRQFLADIDRGECGGCAPTNGEGPLKGMDSGAGGDGGLAGTCNDGNTVDVFTLVHIDAVVEMGGLVAALDEVLLAMEVSNEAYVNSGITLRARTVGIRIVADALFQGDNFGTDLARLSNATDGTFDIGTDSRAEWGADLIKLMRIDDPVDGAGGVVGLAYILTSSVTTPANAGFSVDSWEYSISNLTFPHEMGHATLGCLFGRPSAPAVSLAGEAWAGIGDRRTWLVWTVASVCAMVAPHARAAVHAGTADANRHAGCLQSGDLIRLRLRDLAVLDELREQARVHGGVNGRLGLRGLVGGDQIVDRLGLLSGE